MVCYIFLFFHYFRAQNAWICALEQWVTLLCITPTTDVHLLFLSCLWSSGSWIAAIAYFGNCANDTTPIIMIRRQRFGTDTKMCPSKHIASLQLLNILAKYIGHRIVFLEICTVLTHERTNAPLWNLASVYMYTRHGWGRGEKPTHILCTASSTGWVAGDTFEWMQTYV